MHKLLLPLIFTLSCPLYMACKDKSPLFEKNMTNSNERNNTLFVFVGEKIETKDIPYRRGDFDLGVSAKYKVLVRVYGDYKGDRISFEAYDHNKKPPFTKYRNVLMFVSMKNGKYYMEKYQYYDVYKTKNDRWAGSCQQKDLGDQASMYKVQKPIIPEKIDFKQRVAYPISIMVAGRPVTLNFPQPYYKIEGDSAISIYGNYIEELFKLKRDGVLTARGLFGDGPVGLEDPVEIVPDKEPGK